MALVQAGLLARVQAVPPEQAQVAVRELAVVLVSVVPLVQARVAVLV